jgi:hypothetical protein
LLIGSNLNTADYVIEAIVVDISTASNTFSKIVNAVRFCATAMPDADIVGVADLRLRYYYSRYSLEQNCKYKPR